jgi:hypothetical protein
MGHQARMTSAAAEYIPEAGQRNGKAGNTRSTTGIAWCWQDKKAFKKIREGFDRTNTVSSALVVYVALTEIASDKESPTFETTHGYVAQRSGCSLRTVFSRLKELQEIGLIKIETPALRAPSTITVLPVSQPLPNVSQRAKNAQLRRSEVSLEESPEKKREASPSVVIHLDKERDHARKQVELIEAKIAEVRNRATIDAMGTRRYQPADKRELDSLKEKLMEWKQKGGYAI